ncbi:MAG TPA: acyl-CoA dehydrogenase [Steroidobacteraceae bacterium]|nr:acyl-CoA dehydrogenase [Steroidobacteraceae bacterium]
MSAPYQAPLAMMRLAIAQIARSARHPVAVEDADPILEAAGRFAQEVLSPLNRAGDAAPSRLTEHGVVTPQGFPEAYRRFCNDGWASICAPRELGGQALSNLLAAAVTEIWGGANLAFAMCPEAAVGAVEALEAHASTAIRERYLPLLVSGRWAAAMDLTEPQAGSDLSTLRTLAIPDGDEWRLSGRKIFISWGDHDLAENIVHLILARTPDAPPGLKGLSLFLVPKALPEAGGLAANDIQAVALEHKMGIRASPTCVMALGERTGARGWLIGDLHGGLSCLFTMMNRMRLGVGLHSTGLAERAWQLARSYAQERRQGRDAAGAQRPIIEHADVRRMLLTMKTLTHAARCLAYAAAAELDGARAGEGSRPHERERAARRAGLLTPLVKAWCSDIAVEVASLGVQVHGGAGYIEESEISQLYRDARIGPIFEGTNFIQAQDLLGRKVIRDHGAALEELLADMEDAVRRLRESPHRLPALAEPLLAELGLLRSAAKRLVAFDTSQPGRAACVAYPFLQWLGVLAGGWQWALSAEHALAASRSHPLAPELLLGARFYATHILPRARAHAVAVESPEVLTAAQPAYI